MRRKTEDIRAGTWEVVNVPCPPPASGSVGEILAEVNHEADHEVRDKYRVRFGDKRPSQNRRKV